MTITVATTLAAYVMDQEDSWGAWLYTAEQLQAAHPDVVFFAAIEVDARGLAPFGPLIDRLTDLGGSFWSYSLDDGRTEVTTNNRLRHLTVGQNLAIDFAQSNWSTHLLFMAADCCPPGDTLPKLLEMDHPLVGGEVPTYCLTGPEPVIWTGPQTRMPDGSLAAVAVYWKPGEPGTSSRPRFPDFPVEEKMATAAFVMLRRDLFRKIRFRWDLDDGGMSDDPALWHDAQDFHGVPTYVRMDVVGRHFPESIGPVETRGHDMTVHR